MCSPWTKKREKAKPHFYGAFIVFFSPNLELDSRFDVWFEEKDDKPPEIGWKLGTEATSFQEEVPTWFLQCPYQDCADLYPTYKTRWIWWKNIHSRLKKMNRKLYTYKKTSNFILKCLSYFKMEKISAFLSSSHPGEVEGVSVNVLEYNQVIQLRAHIIQFTL